jgi:hypothetical protein
MTQYIIRELTGSWPVLGVIGPFRDEEAAVAWCDRRRDYFPEERHAVQPVVEPRRPLWRRLLFGLD